jgi:hypothetical protein
VCDKNNGLALSGAIRIARLEILMPIKRRSDQISCDTAVTVRVPSLGEADLLLVRRALMEIAPDWSVDLVGICSEETTLVLLPEDGDDLMGPSFVISREACGLRMDQVHWDALTEVGVFDSMYDVLDALRIRLAFCVAGAAPASVTLH